MKITPVKFTVRELAQGFIEDDETNSVTAMDGNLIVRPEYQRQFVYNEREAASVVNTVLKGYPLGIMYFAKLEDGSGAEYEVMDGQQRLISICRYAQDKSAMSVKIPTAKGGYNAVNFANLTRERKEALLDYELTVYVCEGTEAEKLEWFEIINIAGKALTAQELRSAIYHGPWVTDAKSAFVRPNCAAKKTWGKYLHGNQDRQEWLQTVIAWAADADGIDGADAIDAYMQMHRFDKNADALWEYFERVMHWVSATFSEYRKEMASVDWGLLYNEFGTRHYDPVEMERRVSELMADEEITKPSGIYRFVLDGDESSLSLRQFDKKEKRVMYERQGGICPLCNGHFEFEKMQGDHIIPWSEGGKTTLENGQMLCAPCNMRKGAR